MNLPQAMKRKRVLFVLHNLAGGGAQRVTLALLGEFDTRRYALSLLVMGGPGALSRELPPQVRAIYPPRWMRRGSWWERLAVLLHGCQHDILVAALEKRTTFVVHQVARLLRKPVVLWVHIAFGLLQKELSTKQRRRARAAYEAISSVVFVAEGARRSMAEWLGFEQPGWHVVPNVFSQASYARVAIAETETRTALQRQIAARQTIIGIGRLERRKGFDLLIAALARLVNAGRDVQLLIIGEGELRETLEQQARQAGVADRVLLPGFMPDPLEWLRRASVYALASRLEGLPTTILEAMAVGVPVVATDCPSGPREILQDGTVGLLVPMDDAVAMAAALEQLLASAELRAGLVDKGLRRIEDFLPQQVLGRWDEVLAGATPPWATES